MSRKPRLTLAEARLICEVDADIRQHSRHPSSLEQAFSDLHDGAIAASEVDGLIRKRLLHKIPHERDARHGCGDTLGQYWTVDFTERAMRIFWPRLYAERGTLP